jgi:hypothetical protein
MALAVERMLIFKAYLNWLTVFACAPGGFECHNSPGIVPTLNAKLLQLGVFSLGLFENWDVGVGVFPQSKEILIGGLGFGFIARQSVGSA